MPRDAVAIERAEPDVAVVVLYGEHEAFGAPQLEGQLRALVDEGLSVVVDLTPATFLDSATLFVLLRGRRHAGEKGVGFALQLGAEAGRHVRRAFELTKLIDVFAVGTTREAAVAAAQEPVSAADSGVT